MSCVAATDWSFTSQPAGAERRKTTLISSTCMRARTHVCTNVCMHVDLRLLSVATLREWPSQRANRAWGFAIFNNHLEELTRCLSQHNNLTPVASELSLNLPIYISPPAISGFFPCDSVRTSQAKTKPYTTLNCFLKKFRSEHATLNVDAEPNKAENATG